MPVMNPVEMAIPSEGYLERSSGTSPIIRRYSPPRTPKPGNRSPTPTSAKPIGAFERTLLTPSRFDDFLKGDATALTASETAGLRTFLDVGCATCHSGAALGGTMLQKFGVHAISDHSPAATPRTRAASK